MSRMWWAVVLVLGAAAPAGADEAAERVKANPNDAAAWNAYVDLRFRELADLIDSDPEGALARIEEMEKLVAELEVEDAAAKRSAGRITAAAAGFRHLAVFSQRSLADLEKQLTENPNDLPALRNYLSKAMTELRGIAGTEPGAARVKLEAVKAVLEKVREQGDAAARQTLDRYARDLAGLESSIAAALKLAEMVGKEAPPLAVEAWANGAPLTDADLKGKVVVLDFWAVWCGPCIATFPHLREWEEKYADRGLVIIGLTRYYNYRWDEEAGRAVRGAEPVASEEELAMLGKFAEKHALNHRFAIQAGRDLSEFYGVRGIPHVVVIDRQGKVRMMRVGSGRKNADDVSGLLEQLLPQDSAAD